jgi:hypothetical protein
MRKISFFSIKTWIFSLFVFSFFTSYAAPLPILSGQTITIMAGANSKYVCIDNTNTQLVANSSIPEQFITIDVGGGLTAFQSVRTGKYVCADYSLSKPYLVANRTAIGAWEKFQVIDKGNNQFALIAFTGKYVCADISFNPPYLVFDRTAIGAWEIFTMNFIDPPKRPYGLTGIGSNFLAKKRTTTFGARRLLGNALPAEFSYPNYYSIVRDQGVCGSCWAHAAVCQYEFKLAMKVKEMAEPVSVQQQVSCNLNPGFNACCGGQLNAVQFWETTRPSYNSGAMYQDYKTSCPLNGGWTSTGSCAAIGGIPEPLLPLTTGYYTLNMGSNIDEIKQSIYWDGPAVMAYNIFDNDYNDNNGNEFDGFWYGAKNAIFTQRATTRCVGGHGVVIIGWSDSRKAWLIRNSWGSGGPNNDGTFWMAYSGHANMNAASNPTFLGLENASVRGGNQWLCAGCSDQLKTYIPYYRNNGTAGRWFSQPGCATAISGDPRGAVWIVSDPNGTVWQRLPDSKWAQVNGISARDVSHATSGTTMYVYATSTDNKLYSLNAAGTGWDLVNTGSNLASRVDVDCNGQVYIVTPTGSVFRKAATSSTWTQLPGIAAVDIGVEPSNAYACDGNGYLYKWNDGTSSWVLQPNISSVKRVDVSPGDATYPEIIVVLKDGTVWFNLNNSWVLPRYQPFVAGLNLPYDVGSCSWR